MSAVKHDRFPPRPRETGEEGWPRARPKESYGGPAGIHDARFT